MNRFCKLLGLVGIIGGPIYLYHHTKEDLTSPWLWGDWTHNPLVDFLAIAILAFMTLVVLRYLLSVKRQVAKIRQNLPPAELKKIDEEWNPR